MPKIGQHVDAARFNLRRLRVLILVNHVLIDAFRHQLRHLRFRPGLAECSQVLAGVAVKHQLIVNNGVGVPGILRAFGELILWHADTEVVRSINLIHHPGFEIGFSV